MTGGLREREYIHHLASSAREERVPRCCANEHRVADPSECLDPIDSGGDLARLHIQLVAVPQREVNAEQFLADGDGEGAVRGGGVGGGAGGDGGDVAEGAEAADGAGEERVGEEENTAGEDEDAGYGRERKDGGDGEGGTDGEEAEEFRGGVVVVVEGEKEELSPAGAEVEEAAGEGGRADGERGGDREAGERGGVERGEGLEGGARGRRVGSHGHGEEDD